MSSRLLQTAIESPAISRVSLAAIKDRLAEVGARLHGVGASNEERIAELFGMEPKAGVTGALKPIAQDGWLYQVADLADELHDLVDTLEAQSRRLAAAVNG